MNWAIISRRHTFFSILLIILLVNVIYFTESIPRGVNVYHKVKIAITKPIRTSGAIKVDGGERVEIERVGYGLQTGEAEIIRLKAAESRYDDLLLDKFTIAIATYHRPVDLNKTLTHLLTDKVPSLLEIVVVWNNIGEETPPPFTSFHGVEVRYRASPRNSLNEKLTTDPEYRTRAILLSDDDVYLDPSDLEFAFQVWRKFGQRRVTGPMPRCTKPKRNSNAWDYTGCAKTG